MNISNISISNNINISNTKRIHASHSFYQSCSFPLVLNSRFVCAGLAVVLRKFHINISSCKKKFLFLNILRKFYGEGHELFRFVFERIEPADVQMSGQQVRITVILGEASAEDDCICSTSCFREEGKNVWCRLGQSDPIR